MSLWLTYINKKFGAILMLSEIKELVGKEYFCDSLSEQDISSQNNQERNSVFSNNIVTNVDQKLVNNWVTLIKRNPD